jgi:hypothetical protein
MDHEELMKAVTNFAKQSVILIFGNAALNLLSSELFCKTLCFSQQNFQPFFTHSFFMNLAIQHFIYKHTNLAHLFSDHQELDAHTDIIEFQSTKISTFRWSHPGLHPMGIRLSNQCSQCSRLKSFKPTFNTNKSKVSLECMFCKDTMEYDFPTE